MWNIINLILFFYLEMPWYNLSFRNFAEMMEERELFMAHATIIHFNPF